MSLLGERLRGAHVMIFSARVLDERAQCRTMSCRVLNFACRLQSHNIICVCGNLRNQGLRSGRKVKVGFPLYQEEVEEDEQNFEQFST